MASYQMLVNKVSRVKELAAADPGSFAWASDDFRSWDQSVSELDDLWGGHDLQRFVQDLKVAVVAPTCMRDFKKSYEDDKMKSLLKTFVETKLCTNTNCLNHCSPLSRLSCFLD
jgi:hypothetical protein